MSGEPGVLRLAALGRSPSHRDIGVPGCFSAEAAWAQLCADRCVKSTVRDENGAGLAARPVMLKPGAPQYEAVASFEQVVVPASHTV